MTYFVYFCIGLCLVIIQTAIMPFFSMLDGFYDLVCIFVIYLSLYRPVREGIPVILFFGLVMDNLFGGPFGLYGTTYLWLFIGIKWLITFLQLGNFVLLSFVVVLGILMENLIFIGAIVILKTGSTFPAESANIIGVQLFWAMFTGPLLIMFFHHMRMRFEGWPLERFAKKTESR